ncbi:MAG: hypothetical protein K8S16_13645, partial [Bacteroidales bacterium]|nr:hypothetical protein [Bacteroidales bacterium]
MKKLVLFSLIVGFALSTIAQNEMVIKKNQKRVKDGQEVAVEQTRKIPTQVFNENKGVKDDVDRIYVGKAGHQRGVRREEAHVISYNYDLDVISVTGILVPETYGNVNELGIVGMWYSADQGQTWSDPVILNDNLDDGVNYYLSGAMFNPDGNTVVEDIFGVHQGTIYPTTGDWRFINFGSSTLGGDFLTNYSNEAVDMEGYFNIFGLNQFGNDMRCMNIKTTGAWNAFDAFSFQPIVGGFDGEVFDWDLSSLVEANLYYVVSDGIIAWIGNWQGMDAGIEIAWSDDGQIGYMWIVGVSDEDATGYQPVVFRTEDAGGNWDYVYLDFFDNDIQDILEPYIIECTSGEMIPHIFESAGVVDVNGDLQMMVAMGSTSADVVAYPDSLGWHYSYPGDMFNLSVNDDGISDLMWVDSLRTDNPVAATAGNYCGNGWQHRISAAKSEDEQQVFFTWIDTRDNETYEFNIKPDLFGWSRGFCDDPLIMESSVCFSEGTDLEELFYYNCGSDKAYLNDEGTYTVPYLQCISPVEFITNTSATEDPITLSYITGIEFPVLCLVGIEELASANGVNVTQNMPNPFTG